MSPSYSQSDNILEFRDVGYRYEGGHDVLDGLNFSLERGEMLFLTGPSGAGKSTVLRLAAMQIRATRGQVLMNGKNLGSVRAGKVAAHRRELGMIFQDFQLLHDRSVFDNIALPLVIRGLAHRDISRRVRAALDAVGLLDREYAAPRTLSGGEQQMRAIGRALMTGPSLIMLDEPSLGLAPHLVDEIFAIIAGVAADSGVGVLLVEQNADAALAIAAHGYLIENGRVVMSGAAQALRDNPDIREFYLGGGAEPVDYARVKHYRRRKRWLA